MSRDLDRLTRHSYHGYLSEENVEAIAARLRTTFGDRPIVAVQASPNRNDGTPKVRTGCRLVQPVEVQTFEDGGKALVFSCGGWSHMFLASARDQEHAYDLDGRDRTRIAFDGHTFTASVCSLANLDHYMFAPEGGGE